MKWIGQHIYDLVARFRNDVYLEDLSTTTETNVLVVDSDGKVSKTTVITGDVTGVTAGSNITVTDPTGPVPTVALSTNVDVAGTLDVTDLGTFDASITVAGKISLKDAGNSIFVGYEAGLNDDASTNLNVGVGYQALRENTTGSRNTAHGFAALFGNTTGVGNTANGYAALGGNTTGGGNTALGGSAGAYITDGVANNTDASSSVFLGNRTKALADSQTNQIVIGYDATGLGSNTAILGNSSITTTRLQGGIEINASDTTITRVSAGKIAVEGVNVVTTSSTDTLTNKTLTAPTITGAGAIAGVFTGNITGNVTGNADTVTTNADLTGPVTSTGNITAIASGAITTDMQKHLQTFEFNGYITSAASTNYFIPAAISVVTGPFNHNVSAGASGTTALTPQGLLRTGGKVMPYTGTCKLWKGWVSASGSGAVNISIFKFTPVAGVDSNVSLILVKNFSTTALGNPELIAISVADFTVGFDAGDILITGISCVSGQQVYFTSTLEVEWN
jgi:hypothetical protein